jgi:hypothetical protein
MVKVWLSLMLVYLLVFTAAPVLAGSKADGQAQTPEQIKAKIGQLGVGAKARATIKLKNGTKLKGYVERSGESEFVFRDKETGTSASVLYTDVAKVDANKGHSTAKAIGIGAGIGVAAFLTLVWIVLSIGGD